METKSINMEDFRCKGCRSYASLDEHGHCEFCRPRKQVDGATEYTLTDFPWRGFLAIFGVGLGVGFLIWLLS